MSSFKDILKRYAKTPTDTGKNPTNGDQETRATKRQRIQQKEESDISDISGILVLTIISSRLLQIPGEEITGVLRVRIAGLVGVTVREEDIDYRNRCIYISFVNKTSFISLLRSLIVNPIIAIGLSFSIHSIWNLEMHITEEERTISVLGPRPLKAFITSKLSTLYPLKPLCFPSLTKRIVVSRYRESVSWIPPEWNHHIVLYNKGPRDDTEMTAFAQRSVQSLMQIENVGRESHTYLRYIIDHYDNLPDLIYFTQANPFDHAPDFIALVNAEVGLAHLYVPLGNEVHTIHRFDVSKYEKLFPGIQAAFHRTVQHLLAIDLSSSDVIHFSPGAIFVVKKEAILSRSLEFYQKAIALLEGNINPMEGHAFERLWSVIFNQKHWMDRS